MSGSARCDKPAQVGMLRIALIRNQTCSDNDLGAENRRFGVFDGLGDDHPG